MIGYTFGSLFSWVFCVRVSLLYVYLHCVAFPWRIVGCLASLGVGGGRCTSKHLALLELGSYRSHGYTIRISKGHFQTDRRWYFVRSSRYPISCMHTHCSSVIM